MIFNTVYPGKGGVDLSDIDISVNGSWSIDYVMDAYVKDTSIGVNNTISSGQTFTFPNQDIAANWKTFSIRLDDLTGLQAYFTLKYSKETGVLSILFDIPEGFGGR